jgi:hypothetical protein
MSHNLLFTQAAREHGLLISAHPVNKRRKDEKKPTGLEPVGRKRMGKRLLKILIRTFNRS